VIPVYESCAPWFILGSHWVTQCNRALSRRPLVLGPDLLRTLAEVEREHALRVVEACGRNLARAARVLGIDRTTLVRKLRKWQGDASVGEQ
jgi:ActR/RegA family two-component response regulator